MTEMLKGLSESIRERQLIWWGTMIGFVVTYYAGLLMTMVVRFDNIPNYITFYDWPGNVWTILTSTPSLMDAIEIMASKGIRHLPVRKPQTWLYRPGHGMRGLEPPSLLSVLSMRALCAALLL